MLKAFVNILAMIITSICYILIQFFPILQDYHLSDEEIIGYVFGIPSLIVTIFIITIKLIKKYCFH